VIKDNKTLDGRNIIHITNESHAKVIRICDLCQKEDIVNWRDIIRSRNKKKNMNLSELDTCKKCSYKIFPSYIKGKHLSLETRKKLSEFGKTRFSNPKNKEYLCDRNKENNPNYKSGFRLRRGGHISRRELGKEIQVHREIYEQYNNIKLLDTDIIHHINCNPIDNRINNLALFKTTGQHMHAHRQLESIAAKLVERKIILFNHDTGEYYLDPCVDLNTSPISLGFEDIAITQQKNICQSRLDVNISSKITKKIIRPVPFLASNMSTVINEQFYIKLYDLGALGIMHRVWDIDDNYILTMKRISSHCNIVAASVGVGDRQIELAKRLIKDGNVNVLCIDVAHGFSDVIKYTAKAIKSFDKDVQLIIGNTTNPDIIYDIYQYADSIKVGIAQGLACETKNTAGCTEKQFSTILKFKQISKDFGIPIIGDGGVREASDFVKGIAAGASAIMAGSTFASCPESAAEIVEIDGVKKKLYAGMASRYVQEKWRGGLKPGTCSEGKIVYLDIKRPVAELIERYAGALRSGITYSGATSIKEMQDRAEFIRIPNLEGTPHVANRLV